MPKNFEYRDVKEEIKYYKDLLNRLKEFENICNSYKKDLSTEIDILKKYNYFSNVIKKDIENNAVDFDNDNFKVFITQIYYYREVLKLTNISINLLNANSDFVNDLIVKLSKAKNPILWLFTSKQKKDSAESSYKELKNLKKGIFVASSKKIFNDLNTLKNVKYDYVFNDYLKNKANYLETLNRCDYSIIYDGETVSLFNNYNEEFKKTKNKIDEINKITNDCKVGIVNVVTKFINEEFIKALRNISVEELSRDKSGIKVKCLKDAGYCNLAQIYAASTMQIASIYGISQDKAYTIKSKCKSYADNLRKDFKIKLSVDNKTTSSTNIIWSIYSYLF